ncbi:MAG: aminotransferase class I/II-fold pyridoxal phosphate-dependent enzyme [Clostridia bacterium]|nr:aminotransferase class I/II-fold pyridoxal phosphate-dependent enzyme [Clostridia bacterium]
MQYDFTSIIDRHGMDALAVDGLGNGFAPPAPKAGFDAIPMWVADMNFATVPTVTEALMQRAAHPTYGYFHPREEYFASIIRWQQRRNGVKGLAKEHIAYHNGVLGGLLSAVGALGAPGEKILLHSPTYIGFTNSLTNAGYTLVHSELRQDADGIWRMDIADMEAKIAEHGIRLAVFCSPHNPTGRVWERSEIEAAMDVFRRMNVTVIADEIWSDILLDGHKHIPTQSVSEDARMRTVALYAPSKTFNLAGLVGAYHIVYNDEIRAAMAKQASLSHYNSMNVLSMHALIGAYKEEGYVWVDELCETLSANVRFACDYIENMFDGVRVSRPEGTYMLFLDCGEYMKKSGRTLDDILQSGWDVGVIWQDGRPFHGQTHIRVNLALPLARVQEAFVRLRKYVFQ